MATVVAGAGSVATVPDMFTRDAMIFWFRGEFAAANAIIDDLCEHLARIGGANEYEEVFTAIHLRRVNWIPVIHMQKFFPTDNIAAELRLVAANRAAASYYAMAEEQAMGNHILVEPEEMVNRMGENCALMEEEPAADEEEAATEGVIVAVEEEAAPEEEEGAVDGIKVAIEEEEVAVEDISSGDSSDHKGADYVDADGGSQEEQTSLDSVNICADQEGNLLRPERIKLIKGFMAKESVKGHMVNVVKGLKLYEDIFTESELLSLAEYISELRLAGHRGELSGETFIFFNKEVKGNKREIIQLGVPLFQSATEDAASNIEPIPSSLQTVIDHLILWRLIPETKRPNSCIINFFDEDEHSQPYFKPPHLENPISTLFLSETTMVFGRSLVGDDDGNYTGSLTLPVKEGSLLVMRGNSADTARHVICATPNRRMIVTFVKVRTTDQHAESPTGLQGSTAMAVWQPASPILPQNMPGPGVMAYGPHLMVPAPWGLNPNPGTPVMMMPPPRPVPVMGPNKKGPRNWTRNGTGVFLPWTVGPKRFIRHLPPRIQKRRLLAMRSPLEGRA
ncbi:hypothetical protein Cni_G11924 [Canna indica]|uniref:Fe2OG dioxygenase domain-containing protein n=1 Tax=Canna indica TaxID=4628 RepID=A0AAQ3K7I0_9LILI|nr:hypothetical protein Cni_G11924 [Canna indica]